MYGESSKNYGGNSNKIPTSEMATEDSSHVESSNKGEGPLTKDYKGKGKSNK